MSAILSEDVLKVERKGAIALLTVTRPESLNALNADVLQSIVIQYEKLQKEANLLALVITGSGEKAFVAGADIAVLNQLGKRAASDYIELGQRAMRGIETARFPTVAALNGYALGGGLELALACDLIVASKNAKCGAPEVNLGIIPGFGGTQRLMQRCGIGTTRRLVFTGDIIDAEECLRLGLVDKVVEPEALIPAAEKMANTIAEKGPVAIREAKELIRRSQEGVLLAGLQAEVESFLKVFDTVDREEGMSAFLQKRPAKFIGK